jgi:hypothetical protein
MHYAYSNVTILNDVSFERIQKNRQHTTFESIEA